MEVTMHIVTVIALSLLLQATSPRGNIEFTKDSLDTVKQNVAKSKAVLVDVRSDEEWKQGHIEGSIFLPVTSLRKGGDPKEIAKKLPNKKIIYTFCVVGMRAKSAALELEKQGYTVRPLKPGYEQLVKAGFKVAKQPPEAAAMSDENTDKKKESQ
jgi:rhodanese-related sulfurtransferase